jgi:GT2 family glycosyltransferase
MLDTIDLKIAHLVLIDNGDNLTEMRFPKLIQNVHYIPLPANLGVAGSWNLGIKVLPHQDRWFFGSNDIMFAPGDLQILSKAKTNELTLADKPPFFQVFVVGEEIVREVGLFDESFYPAYHEDNDYLRRVHNKSFPVTYLPLDVEHDNSSTLRSNQMFQNHNNETFRDNSEYHAWKIKNNDFTAGDWSLTRRRRNEWLR